MEAIDRKFKVVATHIIKKTAYTELDGVFFKAGDLALPATLDFYRDVCEALDADKSQIKGIELLIRRVKKYQKEHPERCKVPDVDSGKEEEIVCRPNE